MNESELIKHISIECFSKEEMLKVEEDIHNQLVGLKDYIDTNILLTNTDNINMCNVNEKEEGFIVHVYFFSQCTLPLPVLHI